MTSSRTLRIVVGLAFSAVFLWLSVRGVNMTEVLHAIRSANYLYLVPAMLAVTFSFFVRALRWRVMLNPIKHVTVRNAFSATMIGFMANNVLPMRMGEVVRAVVIGRQESISPSAALATVVVERVFDVIALLIVLLIGSGGYELPPELRSGTWVITVVTVVVFIVFAILSRRHVSFDRLVQKLPGGRSRVGARVGRFLNAFQEGLGILRSSRQVILAFLLSGVIWGSFVLVYYLSLVAFGLELPLRAPLLLLGIVSIGVMLPSAPGYIGTMQAFYTLALVPFAVNSAVGLSSSWFFWIAQYLPVTLIGVLYFFRENLNLKTFMDEKKSDPHVSVRNGEERSP